MLDLYARGSQGPQVKAVRKALAQAMGDDASTLYPGLAKGDVVDADTEAAIRQWQSGSGLLADGIVGPRALQMLGLRQWPALPLNLSSSKVAPLFPGTKPANVSRYLPYVAAALSEAGVDEVPLILAALAFIRVESEGFVPIAEAPSAHNTGGDAATCVAPDTRTPQAMPAEAARYRARGYVHLKGEAAYEEASRKLGVDLLSRPDLATAPEVAAALLADRVKAQSAALRKALARGDFAGARQAFNGETHGLDRFESVFQLAAEVWPQLDVTGSAAGKGSRKAGKAGLRTQAVIGKSGASQRVSQRTRNTKKDAIDIRDRLYLPPPVTLLDAYPPKEAIRGWLPKYTRAGLILDQGEEGACTGFGLASVINYLRWRKLEQPTALESVSPRMLYNFARRYDEYAGENYEGSSCRGAIKGWFNHGVCMWSDWPYDPEKQLSPGYNYAKAATHNTLGVYCRIDTTLITDLQAAIQTVGAVYVSATTHAGWNDVPVLKGIPKGHEDLPMIPFNGDAEQQGGHAFVLVGFNARGFVLQNSWGKGWGAGGFAVIGYEDWLAHAMDAWVVSLGVPGVVAGRSISAPQAGLAGAFVDKSRWWSEATAYEHSIVLGNDGRVKRYLTEDEQTRTLLQQASVLPTKWFREHIPAGQKKRLVIYAHGGLNSEDAAISRARAMGRFFVGNGCYPLFLVWKTGLMESIGNIFSDWWQKQPAGKGFLERLMEKAIERTDRLIEDTIGRRGAKPVWSEMKENAALAFSPSRGGQLLLNALMQLRDTWGDDLEIHLVGHSAGSIILGHMVTGMAQQAQARSATVDQLIDSVHLYAPACTVQFANEHYAPHRALLETLHIDLLSDTLELDDNTATIYRKSLLYLVSNALEADLRTPILGLEKVFHADSPQGEWDGTSSTGDTLRAWRRTVAESGLMQRLRVLEQAKVQTVAAKPPAKPAETIRAAHGSFDNDIEVMTRTLMSITGMAALKAPVDDLRGF
ncbi:MAG: peptidoglycan-binding protein [Aquabacterium sp.]